MGTSVLGSGKVTSLFKTILSLSPIGNLIDLIDSDVTKIFVNTCDVILGGFEDVDTDVRIKDLSLQTSTYGRVIPEVFGFVRLAGNFIWCSNIVTADTYKQPSLDKYGTAKTEKLRRVRASFAIAICRGPVDAVSAIYIDNVMINMNSVEVSIYLGSEDQLPNSTMQSFLGVDKVPAFRDLCYVVFTDFAMENYGGRIPNFTFDIKRINCQAYHTDRVENIITGVAISPGNGEFIYDTIAQTCREVVYANNKRYYTGKYIIANAHNNEGNVDAISSLNDLQCALPNIVWTSLTVSWFGNSLEAGFCKIYPALEGKYESCSEQWKVSDIDTTKAAVIGRAADGRANYSGTPSDDCVVRYIDEMIKRQLKICFYPVVFIDIPGKPWRGSVTGSSEDINNFFRNSGYCEFILHYARLLVGKIDAFVIGSEFVGLTKVMDCNNNFPAVQFFIKLAKDVRAILGKDVLITYAANWTEYHHTSGGWYNMDELWACDDIDMIGINAYFPLTNDKRTVTDVARVMQGWESGEGYEYEYEDESKTIKKPLEAAYAWKNIDYFWHNVHCQPNGKQTAWKPKSKPIWFVEYGFPSVDCATNQPHVFYKLDSEEADWPILSSGEVDFNAQRIGIIATERKWRDSCMVQQKFLWTWDARPYPFFPSMTNVWPDGITWRYGHFVNGKLGISTLGDVVFQLCKFAGLSDSDFDVSDLIDHIPGYVIDHRSAILQEIAKLAQIFFFDACIIGGKIVFKMLTSANLYKISEQDIVLDKDRLCFNVDEHCNKLTKPGKVEILYLNRNADYIISTTYAENVHDCNDVRYSYKTSVALTEKDATNIAQRMLSLLHSKCKQYSLILRLGKVKFMPLDIVFLKYNGIEHFIRIVTLKYIDSNVIELIGVSCDPSIISNSMYCMSNESGVVRDINYAINEVKLEIMDIPNFTNVEHNSPIAFVAVCSLFPNWNGCQIFASRDKGNNYDFITTIYKESAMGHVVHISSNSVCTYTIDNTTKIVVSMYGDDVLRSTDDIGLINQINLALIGDEIVAFRDVTMLARGIWEIKCLLRGRFGTEHAVLQHKKGERFVPLHVDNISNIDLNHAIIDHDIWIKAVPADDSIYNVEPKILTVRGRSIQSFAAVDLVIEPRCDAGFLISYTPRPQIESNFFDNIDAKYKYYIIITDNNNNVLRKISAVNNNKVLYTKSEQIEDFGSVVQRRDFDVIISS